MVQPAATDREVIADSVDGGVASSSLGYIGLSVSPVLANTHIQFSAVASD